MNETIILIQWLLVFSATGLLGSMLFVSENSKMLRYTVGKALGVILLAGISWLLSLSHILPFSSITMWVLYFSIFGGIIYVRRKYVLKFFKTNIKQILLIETIILSLFGIFIYARMMNPRIEGVEKFMDMAILTGLMRHGTGIPLDTWYAPSDINYYYFGHWVVATWAKLSSVPANFAFNLGYASILSLVGAMIFAIVQKLSGKIWAGFLGIFMALFASNIYGFTSIIGHATVSFFKSGRFVDEVINEYPLYSIILGDLHAHMLGLILSVSLFGILVIVADEKNEKVATISYATIGALLGLMSITNSFDIINCGILLAVYFCWELIFRKTSIRTLINRCFTIFIPFGIFLFISILTFSPAVSGIQLSLFKTPLIHIFWQFGAVLMLIFGSLCILLTNNNLKQYIKKFVVSYKFLIAVFIITAAALIFLTELIYFKDIYHYANPPYARANTQFKIWYSAWILLAIGAAAIYGESYSTAKNIYYKIVLIFVGFAAIGVVCFGIFSGYEYLKNSDTSTKTTFNGTNYLNNYDKNKLAVVNYVNSNIKGQPVILQYGGNSYSTNSWLSSYTGTAAFIGWQSHEWGWRYSPTAFRDISKKTDAVKKVYEATDIANFNNSVESTGAKYLIIGPDETQAYKVNRQLINSVLGKPIYSSGQYQLYAITKN